MAAAVQPVFPGATVGPDDPRYGALSTGFNRRFSGAPAYIRLCGDAAQVVRAVQDALDAGKRPTVRSGGHCYEGFVSDNPGGVIIDLSPLRGVYADPELGGAYCVEAGCTLWNVYVALYKEYGVTIPGGSCYSVGAGGHVMGGGYGLLSRKHGLTVDHLVAVEVVCVGADRRAALVLARRGDPDPARRALFWAHTGGGGGNFGIVTRYWFSPDLPRAPKTAWINSTAWNWSELGREQFAELVDGYGRFFAAHAAPGDPYDGLFALFHLTMNNSAAAQLVLTTQYVGDGPDPLTEFVATIDRGSRRTARPVAQLAPVGHHGLITHPGPYLELPWIEATQTFDGSGPNRRGKYKSAYMRQPFPAAQIDAMWDALDGPAAHGAALASSAALLQIDSYGCQVNAVAPDATAVAQRSSILKLQYQIYWNDERRDPENLAWIRDFYRAVYADSGGEPLPNGLTDGCFVNYCDTDLVRWPELYYKGGYAKLVEVKHAWDPHDVFRHAQSIGSAR